MMSFTLRMNSGHVVRLATRGLDELVTAAKKASMPVEASPCLRCGAVCVLGFGKETIPLSPGEVTACFPCMQELMAAGAVESEIERLVTRADP